MSGGWVTINGVAPKLVGSGGVESQPSDSSDSGWAEEDEQSSEGGYVGGPRGYSGGK